MGAGGSYAFDRLTVGALWTHSMFDETAASSLPGALNALRFDNFEVNARYALTPAVSFAGAYTFTNGRYDDATGSHRPKWHQVTLMADYALSKRTDVYAETVYQHQFGVPAGATLGFANVTPRLRRTTRRWSGRSASGIGSDLSPAAESRPLCAIPHGRAPAEQGSFGESGARLRNRYTRRRARAGSAFGGGPLPTLES